MRISPVTVRYGTVADRPGYSTVAETQTLETIARHDIWYGCESICLLETKVVFTVFVEFSRPGLVDIGAVVLEELLVVVLYAFVELFDHL